MNFCSSEEQILLIFKLQYTISGPSKFANVLHDDMDVAEKHEEDSPVVKKVN